MEKSFSSPKVKKKRKEYFLGIEVFNLVTAIIILLSICIFWFSSADKRKQNKKTEIHLTN